jgi:microcystin-dependent protein
MGLLTYTRRAFIGNGLVEVGDDLGTSLDEIRTSVNSISRAQLDTALAQLLVPTGSMTATACATAPSGWLLCDGTSYLRTDLPDLFTAIGTNYGSVDGTHFNVPDLRGRVPVGVDGAANRLDANDALADAGGEEKHVLTAAESGTNGSATTKTDGGGANAISNGQMGYGGATAGWISGTEPPFVIYGAGSTEFGVHLGGYKIPNHAHGLQARSADSAHNNMPPYQIVNWIIKT